MIYSGSVVSLRMMIFKRADTFALAERNGIITGYWQRPVEI